jgi:vacuolar-type H+-ATPase subunit I/STV1
MKKVTIITPPEYEGLVLESLGKARVTQLTHVTGSEFEGFKTPTEQTVDYKELYQRVQTRLVEPLGLSEMNLERVTPSLKELKDFSRDPVGTVDSLIVEAKSLVAKVNEVKDSVQVKNNNLTSELNKKLEAEVADLESAKSNLIESLESIDADKVVKVNERLDLKAKLDLITALEPIELKSCLAVGVIKSDFVPQMKEYLKRYPDTYSKVSALSGEESLLFVFGNEESQKWVEALFLVYDINDIYDVLDPADALIVLDLDKRDNAIKKYKEQLADLEKKSVSPEDMTLEEELREKIVSLEAESEKRVADLKEEYANKIKVNEETLKIEQEKVQEEQLSSVNLVNYYSNVLRTYSRKNAPVLRGKVISILQGYTPENMVEPLRKAVGEVESNIGETLYVEVSDLGEGDEHAPVPEIDFKSEKLQPLWILTRLRGWPSAGELNPGYISVLVFCFQFGLMFGDIGQGLVFLALGLALNGRYKEGLMKYLFALFIPMGIAAIIFGFMYDSIFLYEHAISHWLHEAHIELPFHYPVMPNPLHQTGELMNLIFMVGAIELVFGAMLGAFNAFKAKNYAGMLGEHGFGMGFYVTGLYLSASTMFTEGLDIMLVVAGFPFKIMLLGMGLSFIEPILHSLTHGHGIGGMEAIGEGIGGLLMTFVEGLANMFSFLRIAAFAIAHVSLSGAGESLGHAINSPIAGIIIMNIIALTFEFVSSGVQSVRLLYYEFMGKFFHGEGIRFKPFTIRPPKTLAE